MIKHDINDEFKELFRDMSLIEMIEELKATTTKWEIQCEDRYLEPRIIKKYFIVKPPRPDF